MKSLFVYFLAALCEIAGCFAFWAHFRMGRSILWTIPGLVCLLLFAYLLTRVDMAFAGRAYAAYGGIYIAASLSWLFLMEGITPDRWDYVGVSFCLLGAGIILFAPR